MLAGEGRAKAASMDKSPGGYVVGGGLSEQHTECGTWERPSRLYHEYTGGLPPRKVSVYQDCLQQGTASSLSTCNSSIVELCYKGLGTGVQELGTGASVDYQPLSQAELLKSVKMN